SEACEGSPFRSRPQLDGRIARRRFPLASRALGRQAQPVCLRNSPLPSACNRPAAAEYLGAGGTGPLSLSGGPMGNASLRALLIASAFLTSCGTPGGDQEGGMIDGRGAEICNQVPICAAGLVARGCSCVRPLWAEVAPLPASPLRLFDLVDWDAGRF